MTGYHKFPPGVDNEVVFRTSDNDAEWFKKHPDRKYLARPMVEGEVAPGDFANPWGGEPYIVVRNVMPGTRMRVIVAFDVVGGAYPEAAPDDVLGPVWAQAAGPQGRKLAEAIQKLYTQYGYEPPAGH